MLKSDVDRLASYLEGEKSPPALAHHGRSPGAGRIRQWFRLDTRGRGRQCSGAHRSPTAAVVRSAAPSKHRLRPTSRSRRRTLGKSLNHEPEPTRSRQRTKRRAIARAEWGAEPAEAQASSSWGIEPAGDAQWGMESSGTQWPPPEEPRDGGDNSDEEGDPFLAELRRAVQDDGPLGPREDEQGDDSSIESLYASDDEDKSGFFRRKK